MTTAPSLLRVLSDALEGNFEVGILIRAPALTLLWRVGN